MRCDQPKSTIRNPVAYLHGIIQKALRGELNLLRSTPQSTPTQAPSKTQATFANSFYPTEPKPIAPDSISTNQSGIPAIKFVESNDKPTDSIKAQGYINNIKQMLKSSAKPKIN